MLLTGSWDCGSRSVCATWRRCFQLSIKPARAETHRLLAPTGREIMNADSNRRYIRTHAGLGGMLGSLFVLAATSTALAQEQPREVNVDCTQGETIARALTRGNQ